MSSQFSQLFRLNSKYKEVVQEEVDTFQGWDVIEKSDSPWSCPIVTLDKKDGGIKICQYF